MRIPPNRVVAFAGPYIAFAASAVAAWLIAKVNVLGIPGLDQQNVATWIAGGLTALIVAGLHALGGWGWLKGHHIELAADSVEPGDNDALAQFPVATGQIPHDEGDSGKPDPAAA